MAEDNRSPASKFAEKVLVGILESGARAVAKAVESVASDAKKALRAEAAKAEAFENGVAMWRKFRLGEIEDDLPESLRSDKSDKNSSTTPH
jgi:hypothetical protein